MTTGDHDPALLLEGASGHVMLQVLAREPAIRADRYWDANGLATSVEIRQGGFSARLQASLKLQELTDLLIELRHLADGEAPVARCGSIEGWLELDLTVEGEQVPVTGVAKEPADPATQLRFVVVGVPRSRIAAIGDRLEHILEAFPFLGRRDQ